MHNLLRTWIEKILKTDIFECGRLGQVSWRFGALQYNYTYLLTYLLQSVKKA